MSKKRILLGLAAGAATVGGVFVWQKFTAELSAEKARARRGSSIASIRFGQMEFAVAGSGPPVLVIHGAGGGFDQVLYAAQRLIAANYQVIAPSRFGYLRSSTPIDPPPEHQADAFADLLDHLEIPKVAVIGVSAGAVSVLKFAVRYPERCRSMTLLVPGVSFAESRLPGPARSSRTVIEL